MLALAINAARARATLGEISDAYEKVVGRHKAVIRSIIAECTVRSTVRKRKLNIVRKMADDFELSEGRRPRIMIAKIGQDGQIVEQK